MGQTRFLGGPSILLLFLFLLPGDHATSTAEPQYLVLVPFLIHTETTEKICVQLNHLNESVTLKITLEYGGRNESLIRDVLVTTPDDFQCIPFTIPKWDSLTDSPVVLLTVSVKGATLSFWSRKTVLVQNLDSLVFVQTDKPIYKPGQDGNKLMERKLERKGCCVFSKLYGHVPEVYSPDVSPTSMAGILRGY
uniref:Uncharacterized protein n=1 Tax=Anolis carolinensis TaxID=28377 RepID=A0A803TB23_ANOCA